MLTTNSGTCCERLIEGFISWCCTVYLALKWNVLIKFTLLFYSISFFHCHDLRPNTTTARVFNSRGIKTHPCALLVPLSLSLLDMLLKTKTWMVVKRRPSSSPGMVFTGRLKYTQKHLGISLLGYEVLVLWQPPSILSREIYYTGEWSLDFLLVKENVAFFWPNFSR